MGIPLVGLLDGMAARAVPAHDVSRVGGWLVRRSPNNPFRRPNSVFPLEGGSEAFERDVVACERLYREWGLVPRFQISPASQPVGLAELLLARGYHEQSVTAVYVCELAELGATPRAAGMRVSWSDRPEDKWWATRRQAVPIDRAQRVASDAMLRRIAHDVAYVRVTLDGVGVGVGMSVQEDSWFGIFYIATTPDARRRGVGRVVVDSLMHRAKDGGARRGYVQVEAANLPALALYRQAGYRKHVYDYRYLSDER